MCVSVIDYLIVRGVTGVTDVMKLLPRCSQVSGRRRVRRNGNRRCSA
jgi:hypothetical protein